MRITVEIDDGMLDDLARLTGESKRSPAVAKAVREYVYRQKAKEFGFKLRTGVFHYDVLNDAMEATQDTISAPPKP